MIGVRHAEEPGETANVDICFVPATHEEAEAVPAVSGSSGRLVVSAPKVAESEPTWPGKVFEQEELSYVAAMDQYVAAREAKLAAKTEDGVVEGQDGVAEQKAEKLALRSEVQRLQIQRREERSRRKATDEAWKVQRQAHRETLGALQGVGREFGRARAALQDCWRAKWSERHVDLARRREEDRRWREARQELRQREGKVGMVTAWIAILVIVDNCTRRSLGLPLFTLGAHVTAELVVEALEALLPQGLRYLITDGAKHFTAEVMKELAKGRGFVRVPLAKHRPQSNGIAERFIKTLKDWLADKHWETAEELTILLAEFIEYYNDRPHQGRELAGLSPNEYAARKAAA